MYPQCGFHIFPATYYSNTATMGSNQKSQVIRKAAYGNILFQQMF